MKASDFRRIALILEGAEEGSHMGAVDFRVGGRIFATLASEDKGYGNLMLTRSCKRNLSRSCRRCSYPFLVDGDGWGAPTFGWQKRTRRC